MKKAILPTLTLFGSFSTLLCCALPALLVSFGAGAVMIGIVSAVPQLVWLSEHKIALFIFAGVMLVVSGISRYLSRNASCPVDQAQARACICMRRISFAVYLFSLGMYATGFFFAFIAYRFI